MPSEWVAKGFIKRADSVRELADVIGLDPASLDETVWRFNEGAKSGRDPEFRRGESQYNRVLGDRTNKPSPCLGPVDTAPYYAVPIELSDVGTIGGAVSDECARVLGPDGTPIPGLYATGNMSATVMGRHYLGAGASVGNTMTFGYLAARHAAGSPSARTESKG